MRLTDEDVRRHKENKYSVECVKGKVKMSDGDIIGNLCDTIEALQQEYDELDTGHSKLFKAYCEMKQEAEQLQAQAARMREAMKQVQHDIDGAECRDDLDGIKGYIDEAIAAIDKGDRREGRCMRD